MATINPEVRAAEIVAATRTDYSTGGWFEIMTGDECRAWELAEWDWWTGRASGWAPRNNRELAGWLAFQVWRHEVDGEVR